MRLRSLRLRLTLMAAAMIGATLLVAGLSLSYIFEHHLEVRLEQELDMRWLELASAVNIDQPQPLALSKPLSDPRYEKPYSGAYWRVTEQGVTILRSRSLWDQDISISPRQHLSPTNKAIEAYGPNQSVLYMMEREVSARAPGQDVNAPPRKLKLAVALDYGEIENLRAAFESDVVRALLAIASVLVLGSWMQTSFGLRPLRILKQSLARIHAGEAARLTGPFPDEVAPLALDVNRLLERQDQLVQKARGRAGDLAHGLKTPLSILSGEAERLEKTGDRQTSFALREQIAIMVSHIERELARARTHGVSAAGGILTDPKTTIDRLISLVARMPRGDGLEFHNDVLTGLRLQMDPDDFGEVMGNLLDNARKHAKQQVWIGVEMAPDTTKIIVSDDGPGIPLAIRQRILQRGEKGTTGEEGTGLGLAIVQDVLAEYGTTVLIDDAPGGGCRISFNIGSLAVH